MRKLKGSGQKYLVKGEWLDVPNIAKKYQISMTTIRNRIKAGLSGDDLIKSTSPKKWTINGETMTIAEFERKYNIDANTLRFRLTHGVPEKYVLMPKLPNIKLVYKEFEHQKRNSLSWTKSALDCYDIGADCKRCYLPLDIQKRCKMAETIKAIVKEYGKPYDRENFLLEE